MEILLITLLIGLNVAIAWWNCYVTGSVWEQTKRYGSTFDKALLWSGAIQSVAGFSIPILLALTWLATLGSEPPQAKIIWEGVMSLWYLAVIIPVVGSGFIIWAHSVKVAIERRDFGSIAVAGYNTFAQASNTMSMFNNTGGAMSKVGGLFKDRDGKEALGLLVILLVVVALLSSALLTAYLIKYYAAKARILGETNALSDNHATS